MAPLPTIISSKKIREPDVVFKFKKNLLPEEVYFEGADLIMEVVSPDKKSRQRDYEKKVVDYAEGGIPEYWIVDPQEKKITVLTLEGTAYATHGVFGEGAVATSKLLSGFSVNVTDVFQAAKA